MKVTCTGKQLQNGTAGIAAGPTMVLITFAQSNMHQITFLMPANDADQYRLGEQYTVTIGPVPVVRNA